MKIRLAPLACSVVAAGYSPEHEGHTAKASIGLTANNAQTKFPRTKQNETAKRKGACVCVGGGGLQLASCH